MSKQANKGLGKGFGSLLPQNFDQSMLLDKGERVQKIAVTDIVADPDQPRREFDPGLIDELAQSIKQYGILQPLVVTEHEDGYKIVAGERRFRAAQKVGLERVPALVRSLEEMERLEISLVENVQRVDLSPLEQAVSIARLHEQFNMSYQDIASRLGKAHSTIVNITRLLQLPDFARKALASGKISEGHARQVLALKDELRQRELVKNIEQNGWSVRQAEQFVSENKRKTGAASARKVSVTPVLNEKISRSLSTKWGFRISVSQSAKGGKVTMSFKDEHQLSEFVEFLQQQK